MKVVAEGVETHQEEDMLRRQGCDEIQGYLYSRPLSPRDLAQWLRQQRPMPMCTDASGEAVLLR
jgi:EAL domain-containing protein (putative c-di-GMP-specific phosphodiesterase class I)